MLTVHPSIILGSYVWDEERLPRDEFEIRMQAIHNAMASEGWAATLVYGDAREHAALAYFSNFIPRMRWAMALIPAKGNPRLLASMSSRDIPAMRTMTWMADVKSGWEWKWFDEWVASLEGQGKIGTIGLDNMTPLLFGSVTRSLGERFTLADADHVAAAARRQHRPREVAVIQEAAAIVGAASDALRTAWREGLDIERAALAAERVARGRAAHDIRTLVSRDGGCTFQPFQARFEDRPAQLMAYIAVKYLGYWADAFVVDGAPPALQSAAEAALAAAMAALEPGAPLDRVAHAAEAALDRVEMHPALSGSFGNRIGLSVCEGDEVKLGASGVVAPETVYTLRSGAIGGGGGSAMASAMVQTRRNGAPDILLRSTEE